MRDLEDFAEFIVDQLVSPLDNFIQRHGDELFLMKGTKENTNTYVSIRLEDDLLPTKVESTEACAALESNLFYHLLRIYCWKNKIDNDRGEVGLGNLKEFLKRNEFTKPRCLLADSVKIQNEYKFFTEYTNGKNKDKVKLNQRSLDRLARKIIQDCGGIRFKDGMIYYDRVSSEDFKKNLRFLQAHQSSTPIPVLKINTFTIQGSLWPF